MKIFSKKNEGQWSMWGNIVLIPVPIALWIIAVFVDDYFKDSDIHLLAMIFKISALILLVFSLLIYVKGASENMYKFMLKNAPSECSGEAIEASSNANDCLIVDADSVLHPSVIDVLHFMATLVPDGTYEELSREHQVMTEVGVYLQYQRIDQALGFLAELENKSASVNDLISRLVALKGVEGTDLKSLELRKLEQENEHQRNEIQFWRTASLKLASTAGK